MKTPGMEKLMSEYAAYKKGYLHDPVPYIDPYSDSHPAVQKTVHMKGWYLFTATWAYISLPGWVPEVKLQVVHIYFNSPTFDRIAKVSILINLIKFSIYPKDAKTNTMTQISVIGGTLGLFTGFSIMSGIEIVYFIVKIVLGRMKNTKIARK